MSKGKIIFRQINQDSQELGSDDEHMCSRVLFDIEFAGSVQKGIEVDIKQTVGSDYNSAPLEVSFPKGYNGPLDYHVFREYVERCYRDSFGPTGRMIRIAPGAHVRMRNNIVLMNRVIEFEMDEQSKPSGW